MKDLVNNGIVQLNKGNRQSDWLELEDDHGVMEYKEGHKYKRHEGQVKDGLLHGEGIMTHANGRKAKELWENNKFIKVLEVIEEGEPEIEYADSFDMRGYKGGYVDGQEHGQGVLKFDDGSEY